MQLQPKRVVTYTQINALSDEEIQNTPCFTNLKTVYANTLAYIEREDITKENIIPFRKTGPYLWVGTLENTWTEKKRRLLRSITGLEIKPLFITQEFYKQLEINCLRYKDQENPQKALDATSSNIRLSSQDFVENSEITDSSPEESFKKLILLGVGENASDIHIERTTQNTQIKLRIDGRIDTFTPLDTRRGEDLCNYIKAHTGLLSKNNSGTGTADSSYRLIYDTRIIGLRLSSISQQLDGKWEDKLVIRILDPKNAKTNLDETNLNKDDIKIIRRALNKEKGIILVTGPTGSGKSTTLFAAASELVNREAKKNDRDNIVYSLEDPIEYKLPGIFQVQANENNGVSFNDALRGLMRLDLDALLIQEIRDTETAKVALKASDTGHLVLSTLHTNDTVNTFSRLINGLDANREQVLNNVVLITAQRLYGKRCVYCRKQTESQRWYNTGCPECKNRGIKGRVAVVESLLIEDYPEIIPILKNELNEEKVKKILRDKGWKSYHDQAKELSKLGIIEF
jgi:type IV pilus assembly protein PilB